MLIGLIPSLIFGAFSSWLRLKIRMDHARPRFE